VIAEEKVAVQRLDNAERAEQGQKHKEKQNQDEDSPAPDDTKP